MLAQAATLALAALSLSTAQIAPFAHARSVARPRASTCNGYSELCTRSFGNVTLVGAHDSYAVGANNLAANQDYDVTQQLNDGIRMLQVQAHNSSGTIHLCHTSCALLDGGTLESYLQKVKSWVDANPNDVISILIVNIDDLPPTAYSPVFESVGLDALSYAPSSAALASTAWPSLGEMIDQGKRVVTFMDFKADFTVVPYLIDEFTNVWETAYDVTDQTFNCELNRTGTADNKMYLINHFLDKEMTLFGQTFPVPNKDLLNVTNGVSGKGSLGLQAQECGAQWGKYPSFMLVDFYDYGGGSVFEVAASLNGVSYNPASSTIAPPITATATTTGSGAASPSASYHRNGRAAHRLNLMGVSAGVMAFGTDSFAGIAVGLPIGASMMTVVALLLSWTAAFGTVL